MVSGENWFFLLQYSLIACNCSFEVGPHENVPRPPRPFHCFYHYTNLVGLYHAVEISWVTFLWWKFDLYLNTIYLIFLLFLSIQKTAHFIFHIWNESVAVSSCLPQNPLVELRSCAPWELMSYLWLGNVAVLTYTLEILIYCLFYNHTCSE